jgi:hypothetical protein
MASGSLLIFAFPFCSQAGRKSEGERIMTDQTALRLTHCDFPPFVVAPQTKRRSKQFLRNKQTTTMMMSIILVPLSLSLSMKETQTHTHTMDECCCACCSRTHIFDSNSFGNFLSSFLRTAKLTMVIDSLPLHAIYIDVVGVLDAEDAVDAVAARDSSLAAVHGVWRRAVAVLRICRCHLR